MARLFGREWTRRELLERVGDLAQVASADAFTYTINLSVLDSSEILGAAEALLAR